MDTLSDQSLSQAYKYIKLDRKGQVFVITLDHGAENKLNLEFCREIIGAFHTIQATLGPDFEGAVITRGNNPKFFCTVGQHKLGCRRRRLTSLREWI